MTLAARLRRERTNAASKPNLVFYAPGNMTLPYGKLNLTVGGRGTPGNSTVPGNVANYNSPVPGNIANYNPTVAGNAKYNPPTGGNYAGTTPPQTYGYAYTVNFDLQYSTSTTSTNQYWSYSGAPAGSQYYSGNHLINTSYSTSGSNSGSAYYNPYVPGNAILNPYTPGNIAYYNPGSGGNYAGTNPSWKTGSSYTDYYDNINGNHDYSNNDHPWSGYSPPPSYTYTANGNYPGYSVVNFYVINSTPGNPYYNPYYPGNAVYNPGTPGNPTYNPPTPGTANYNPVTPGTANYNPTVPGTAAPDTYVFGVKFPGGAGDTTAPLVADTKIALPYQNAAVAVYVPPSGTVTVKGV